jgi:hypothetical protein
MMGQKTVFLPGVSDSAGFLELHLHPAVVVHLHLSAGEVQRNRSHGSLYLLEANHVVSS